MNNEQTVQARDIVMQAAPEVSGNRNHTIDLLRFIFMIAIVVYHQNYMCFSLFSRGNMAVYFFFILSGYLARASVNKHIAFNLSYSFGLKTFIKRKIKAVHPEVILSSLVFLLVYLFMHAPTPHAAISISLQTFFSDMLFLRMTGIQSGIGMDYGWYISSMLLALGALYPLLRTIKNDHFFLLAGILLIGYVRISTGSIMPNFSETIGFTYAGNYIAVGAISLGAYISSIEITNKSTIKHATTIIFVLLAICLYCLNSHINDATTVHPTDTLCLLSMSILIALSKHTNAMTHGGKWQNICIFLGRLSLPLYLIHMPCHMILNGPLLHSGGYAYMICYLSLSVVAAYILMLMSQPMRRMLAKWYE